jgi:RimJ/RimL family protein N-acetyltransferase
MIMVYIETERTLIKPHTLNNIGTLNAWENDPDLLFYNDDQPDDRQPDSLDETRQFIERVSQSHTDRKIVHYAIHLKDDDRFIGYGMMAFIDRYNRRCKLGITIGDKQQWGKGFAREVLAAVMDYCFTELGMNRIEAEVYAFNERSIRLFEGLGFQREGTMRQSVWKKGVYEDELIYGLLKSEWVAG